MTRCNYFTTIEGVIVSRQIGEWLKEQAGLLGYIVSGLWLAAEVTFNAFDDAYVLATGYMGWRSHKDLFNASIIVGRILKMCFAYWIQGFLFQGLNEDY